MLARHSESLTILQLGDICIGDTGVEHLAVALPSLLSLTELRLYGGGIDAVGTEHLAAALSSLGSLTYLDIKDNSIGDMAPNIWQQFSPPWYR